jgi:hypothetical protein
MVYTFLDASQAIFPMEAKILVSDGEIGQDEANAYIAFINPSDVANVVTT